MTGDFDATALAAHLRKTYGIDATAAREIQGGHLYRVDRADGPTWVARPFPSERPAQRVETEADILRYLEALDYPAERCAHAEPVSTLDGWTVIVTTLVDGAPPGNGGRSNVPVATFAELGRLIGLLHASDLPDDLRRPSGSWHGDPAYEGAPHEDINAATAWLDEAAPKIAARGGDALTRMRDEIRALDDCSDLPHAFVHPDFCPVNAITAPDGSLVMVDWAGSGWGPRINSLGNLLSHTPGPHAGTADERLDAVLDAYTAHVQLQPTELDRLASVMRIRTVLFACYTYRMSVNTGYTPMGDEGWWPDHRATDALAVKVAERLSKPA